MKLTTAARTFQPHSLSSTRLQACQSPRSPAVQGVADVFLPARPAADPPRLISSVVPGAPSSSPALPVGTLSIHHHTTILPQPQVRGNLLPSPRETRSVPRPGHCLCSTFNPLRLSLSADLLVCSPAQLREFQRRRLHRVCPAQPASRAASTQQTPPAWSHCTLLSSAGRSSAESLSGRPSRRGLAGSTRLLLKISFSRY